MRGKPGELNFAGQLDFSPERIQRKSNSSLLSLVPFVFLRPGLEAIGLACGPDSQVEDDLSLENFRFNRLQSFGWPLFLRPPRTLLED